MKITTDFIGSESGAETRNRIAAIASFYGVTAPQTWGNIRAGLNPFLPVPIANGELAGSFLPKINSLNRGDMHWLNDLGGVVMWYDPSDLSTMFQDRNGSVPVTAPGQLVGVQLDKGKSLARGPELVVNGNFAAGLASWAPGNDAGGSTTVDGGAANLINATGTARLAQNIPTVVGRTYEVTFDVLGSASLTFLTGDTALLVAAPGSRRVQFVASVTSTPIAFRNFANGTTATFDNVSIRELPGAHKTAINDAARGTLARHPASGIRNTIRNSRFSGLSVGSVPFSTSSEGLTLNRQSNLGVPALEIATVGTDEVGEWIDVRVFGENTSGAARFYNIVDTSLFPALAGSIQTLSVDLQIIANTGARAPRVWFLVSRRDAADTALASWNQHTAAVTSTMTRFTLVTTPAPTGTAFLQNRGLFLSVEVGDIVDFTLRIRRMQIEPGGVETAYQATRQFGNDVTEAGIPDVWSIRTDGLNTGYVTPTVTPGTDKAQVFAAVRKLSDAGFGTIVELGITSDVTPGSFGLFGRNQPGYTFSSMGSVRAAATVATGFPSPDTAVLTGLGNISGDSSILKRNGVQLATNTGDQGTGNYATAPLYFYRRNGSINPLNGNAYGEVVRFGDPLTPAQIDQTERWLASKRGVTL